MVDNLPKVRGVVIAILVITRNVFNTLPDAVVTSISWNWRVAETYRLFDSATACAATRAPPTIKQITRYMNYFQVLIIKMKNVRLPIAPTTINWNDITTVLGNTFSFIAPAVKKQYYWLNNEVQMITTCLFRIWCLRPMENSCWCNPRHGRFYTTCGHKEAENVKYKVFFFSLWVHHVVFLFVSASFNWKTIIIFFDNLPFQINFQLW